MGTGSIYLLNVFLEAEVTLRRTVKDEGKSHGKETFKCYENYVTPVAQQWWASRDELHAGVEDLDAVQLPQFVHMSGREGGEKGIRRQGPGNLLWPRRASGRGVSVCLYRGMLKVSVVSQVTAS